MSEVPITRAEEHSKVRLENLLTAGKYKMLPQSLMKPMTMAETYSLTIPEA